MIAISLPDLDHVPTHCVMSPPVAATAGESPAHRPDRSFRQSELWPRSRLPYGGESLSPVLHNVNNWCEDNLYISDTYGYDIPNFANLWFSRGGFSMQANELVPSGQAFRAVTGSRGGRTIGIE